MPPPCAEPLIHGDTSFYKIQSSSRKFSSATRTASTTKALIYEKIGEKRGEKQGELKKAKSIAISLAQEGESIERIARILGETEKTIKEWLAETH